MDADGSHAPSAVPVLAATLEYADLVIVRWVNNDTIEHDIVGADGTSSPALAPGATYERRFNTAGTFSYTCSFHPFMAGTVTIQ